MMYGNKNAEAAYQSRLEEVTEKLEKLAECLSELKNAEYVNWGHVGDAGYVNERLGEILQFLGK